MTLNKPKSVMITFPFSKNIFLLLRSLCIMPFACKYPIPYKNNNIQYLNKIFICSQLLTCDICWATIVVRLILNLSLSTCICLYNVIPFARLVTIANLGSFIQAPINRIKFSWRVLRKVATYCLFKILILNKN